MTEVHRAVRHTTAVQTTTAEAATTEAHQAAHHTTEDPATIAEVAAAAEVATAEVLPAAADSASGTKQTKTRA